MFLLKFLIYKINILNGNFFLNDDILYGNFFLNIQKLTKNESQFFFIKYDETEKNYTIMCLYSHQYLGV